MRHLALFASLTLLLSGSTCKKGSPETDWHQDPPRPTELPRVEAQRPPSATAHPRVVLTEDMLARVKAHAAADTAIWGQLHHNCELWAEKDLSSGYLGAFWGRAVVDLTLCWYATGEQLWHDKAFHYLDALLDDKKRIGDGEGGNEIVRPNKGYPIRNYGVFAAIAYDWLHDAPGMTDARKKKIGERLSAWIDWYQDEGYLNDNAYANYFWGYMTTLGLAALALHGEHPEADAWLEETRRLLDEKIVPGFYTYLKGGAWAEGWQYGQLVAVELAMLVRGFQTAAGTDYTSNLPWLSEIVDSRLHRLRPDGASVYGNGTQAVNPSPPKSLALYAALLTLERSDADKAAEARYLIHEVYPKVDRDYVWFAVLTDDPDGEPRADPRVGEPLSYHMEGPGLTFARSSWDEDAVWTSFQAGPRIAVDHQNQDQGHIELWRGADGLLIDGGDEHSSGTINHNSILVDDGRKILRYAPSQGIWGKKVKTTQFADDGEVVVAVGELAEAWRPKCITRGCDDREVARATRTFVFLRPDVLVTDDVVEVENEGTWVAWSGHVRRAPRIAGNQVSTTWGGSRLDLSVLLPETPRIDAPAEPTETSDHTFRRNPIAFDELYRIQVATPEGSGSRRMRVWARAAAASAAPSAARRVDGKGLGGALGQVGERTVAVLFADATSGGSATLPGTGADALVVTGLEVDGRYQVELARSSGCAVTVRADPKGAHTANAGGFLRVGAEGCTLAAPE